MKISKKNLKILIESFLKETSASSISEDELTYVKDGNGIYSSKKASLDPYTYQVVYPKSKDGNQILVKITSAPKGRSSAVGKTFKITTSNMDNPNVQLLYSAIKVLDSGNITPLTGDTDLKGGKFAPTSGEYVDIGNINSGFPALLKKIHTDQHSKIIKVGKENANTTLVSDSSQSSNIKAKLEDKNLKTLHDLAKAISEVIENNIVSEVASVIFYGSNNILYCDVMAKTGSLEYKIFQGNTESRNSKMKYEDHVNLRKPEVGEVFSIKDNTKPDHSNLQTSVEDHVNFTSPSSDYYNSARGENIDLRNKSRGEQIYARSDGTYTQSPPAEK